MASIEATKIPTEQKFMGDFWNFRKSYYSPEESDDYWTALIDAATALSEKYKIEYLDQMILVCVDDIEQRYKKQSGSRYVCRDVVKRTYDRIRRVHDGNKNN